MNEQLSTEQYRVLLNRITKALHHAKYEPATVAGDNGPAAAAEEVLRPYKPKETS